MIKNKLSQFQKRFLTCLCAVVMFLMLALVQYINKVSPNGITIGNITLMSSTVSGIFTAASILISIIMTCIYYKLGCILAMILIGGDLFVIFGVIFLQHSLDALPSIPILLTGFIGQIILYKQFAALEMTSYTDYLTGLLNRRGIYNRLQEYANKNQSFYAIYIDLDGFKQINDSMGHKVGDTVLCTITQRLRTISNPWGLLGRIGGDEFLIVVKSTDDSVIHKITDECIQLINEPVPGGDGNEYTICASIGCAQYPKDAKDINDLIKNADIAMLNSKQFGKNQLAMFDFSMAADLIKQEHIEKLIKESLEKDYFYLVYQPQYYGADKKLRGFETLIRMKTPDEGVISPGIFIPVAEKSDLIFDIDLYVLKRALKEFTEPIRHSGKTCTLSVNISAKHITAPDFVDDVKVALEESGFPVECLEIEITEYCFVASIDEAVANIEKLKSMGIMIALDDFGTGYASLSYLSKLPIDLVKIDKSFVDDIATDETACDFISAVISIGHILGCKVISEGVETDEQLDLLKDRECDYIQGYVWGRPLEYCDARQLCDNAN